MATPNREQMVQSFELAKEDWLAYDDWQYADREAVWKYFYLQGRADLEATIAEQAAEIDKGAIQFLELSAQICSLKKDVSRLQMALADTEALEIGTSEKVSQLMNHIDDVNEVICDPYRWCDDIDVLRKIEKLLQKGSQLIGDKS